MPLETAFFVLPLSFYFFKNDFQRKYFSGDKVVFLNIFGRFCNTVDKFPLSTALQKKMFIHNHELPVSGSKKLIALG